MASQIHYLDDICGLMERVGLLLRSNPNQEAISHLLTASLSFLVSLSDWLNSNIPDDSAVRLN